MVLKNEISNSKNINLADINIYAVNNIAADQSRKSAEVFTDPSSKNNSNGSDNSETNSSSKSLYSSVQEKKDNSVGALKDSEGNLSPESASLSGEGKTPHAGTETLKNSEVNTSSESASLSGAGKEAFKGSEGNTLPESSPLSGAGKEAFKGSEGNTLPESSPLSGAGNETFKGSEGNTLPESSPLSGAGNETFNGSEVNTLPESSPLSGAGKENLKGSEENSSLYSASLSSAGKETIKDSEVNSSSEKLSSFNEEKQTKRNNVSVKEIATEQNSVASFDENALGNKKHYYGDVAEYKIIGEGTQYIEIDLYKNKSIICNDMSLVIYYSSFIEVKSIIGNVEEKNFLNKMKSIGKDFIDRKQLVMTYFKNNSSDPHKISFMPYYSGSVIPVELENSKRIFCCELSIICAFKGINIKNVGREVPFNVLNTIKMKDLSGDSLVFLSCLGKCIIMDIKEGEKIFISTESFLAMESTLKVKLKSINNNINASSRKILEVSGYGRIWLNSMTLENFKDTMSKHAGNFFGIKKKKKKFLSSKK